MIDRFLLRLPFLFLLVGSTIAVAQNEMYDPAKLSEVSRKTIAELESFVRDSIPPGSDVAGMLIDSKMARLKCSFSNTEAANLVHHPVPQIRQGFVDGFVYNQLKTGRTEQLFRYLEHYWADTIPVDYSTGCILNTNAFGDFCFNRIYARLDASQQQHMRETIIEAALPMGSTQSILEHLPFGDSTYHMLERLVYEKHLFMALTPLLSYKQPKDADAVLLFTSTDRRDAQWIMADHFRESYQAYLEAAIPELLANTWSYDACRGYAVLLGQCAPETTDRLVWKIVSSFSNDSVYRCAETLYSELRDSIPAAERDSFLLTIFPSLGILDTTDAGHLRRTYPAEFEQQLEQRLLLAPCPDDYSMYIDSAYTRFMLRDYTAQPSAHKTEFYRKLIRTAAGPPLAEAFEQLKTNYREEVVAALEEQYTRLAALQSDPGRLFYYGQEMSASRALESIEKCIVQLNDTALNRRTAQAIIHYYGNPWTNIYDAYEITILKTVNDPALYEQLLQRVESQPYVYSYSAIIGLLLSFDNPAYDQRLKQRYLQLQRTMKQDEIRWFRTTLEEHQLLPPEKRP
jgi:hypothetical protein